MRKHFIVEGSVADVPDFMPNDGDSASGPAKVGEPPHFWRFTEGEWGREGSWSRDGAIERIKACDVVVHVTVSSAASDTSDTAS
jgi:hypothetical protein